MSKETLQFLNDNTLVGYTDKRGKAWHHDGSADNHFPGPVPIERVRNLLDWKPLTGDVTSTVISADGVATYTDPTRKAMIRPVGVLGAKDAGGILGIFKQGYTDHPYGETLVDFSNKVVGDDTHIASAGMLKQGAQAWVQVEVEENLQAGGSNGVPAYPFRPFLLAATSLDGSMATTYRRCTTAVVCDNTMGMAMGENKDGGFYKIKHSRYSVAKIENAAQALGVIMQAADEFQAQFAALTAIEVDDKAWMAFLDAHSALTDEKGEAKTGRALTLATNERLSLDNLWSYDERVAPWAHTAFGVVQAVNTHTHWNQTVRATADSPSRSTRNDAMKVTGAFDKLDATTLATLQKVLVSTS